MKNNLLIIGSGQLGSRHLQSLAHLNKEQFDIYVYDPFEKSLEISEQRYQEIANTNSPNVTYTSDFSTLPNQISVAIIATNSKVRRASIENLIQHSKVDHLILEKFLFTKKKDYEEMDELFQKHQVNVFVNTPRRSYSFYKELKENVKFPFQLEVSGTNWGMGCNAIHFLDLFYFLNGQSPIEIYNLMDDDILQSKRDGYIEFTGSLLIRDIHHNVCLLTSYKEGTRPSSIAYTDANKKINFHENQSRKVAFQLDGEKFNYGENPITPPRQSDSTSVLVQDLIQNGTCDIAPYSDSKYLHLKLLDQYLEKYSAFTQQKEESCPIT